MRILLAIILFGFNFSQQLNHPNGIEIKQLAIIMSDILSEDVVLDSQLNGKVKIILPSEVDRAQAKAIFIAALDSLGFKLQRRGKVLNIVRANLSVQKNSKVYSKHDHFPSEIPLTLVYPLNYLEAIKAIKILRPITQVRIQALGQQLVINAGAAEAKHLKDILQLLDRPQKNHHQVKIHPLKHATPQNIAKHLKTIITFSHPGKNYKVIPLPQAVATYAPPQINQWLTPSIQAFDSPSKKDDLSISVRPLNFADAQQLAKELKNLPGKIIAYPPNNSLLIKASKLELGEIEHILRQIDQQRPQVHLALKILEISSQHSYLLNTSAALSAGNDNVKVLNTWRRQAIDIAVTEKTEKFMSAFNSGIQIAAISSGGVEVKGLGKLSPAALIQMLKNDTETQTLAEPSMVTQDRQATKFSDGSTFFYSVPGKGKSPDRVERENVDLLLEFTPTINRRDVKLQIKIKAAELRGISTLGYPEIGHKANTQTILVPDQQWIMISGIQNSSQRQTSSGIPFIKNLPLIGLLFSDNQNQLRQSQLVMFLQVKILRSQSDWLSILGQEKAKTEFLKHQQATGI